MGDGIQLERDAHLSPGVLKVPEYNVLAATVISNEREVYQDGKITYMPVYFVMFMEADAPQTDDSEYIF